MNLWTITKSDDEDDSLNAFEAIVRIRDIIHLARPRNLNEVSLNDESLESNKVLGVSQTSSEKN